MRESHSSTNAIHAQALRALGDAIVATPVEVLEASVPTCPGWSVHDLVAHVGAVHRWAADRVAGTRLYRGYDGIEAPSGEAVLAWYRAGRDLLIDTLAERDPDDPAWTFVGPGTVAFWYRRQAHEIAVHLWDVDSGARPGRERAIDAELALDGIDEWLTLFAPRFIEMGPGIPDDLVGRSVHLHATDIDGGEWVLDITATGIDHRREHVKADVAIRGSASDLLLTLWRRRAVADMDTVGDAAVAHSLLDLVRVT